MRYSAMVRLPIDRKVKNEPLAKKCRRLDYIIDNLTVVRYNVPNDC